MAFKDIAHWALMGIGSVLSVVPGIGPIVGGALIAAGVAIPTSQKNSVDAVSNSSAALTTAMNNAAAYGATSSGTSVINVSGILTWLKANWIIVAAAIAGIIFLPKLFKSRR